MGSLRWVVLTSIAACGSPVKPAAPPAPKPITVESPPLASPPPTKVVDEAKPVPKPAPPPFSVDSLPVIKPLAAKKDSAVFTASDQESQIEIYAVDVDAESLLFATTPRINWVFKATGKRFTGALYAADHNWDAFSTIADQIGADASEIKVDKKYRGATLDLEFSAAPTREVLRLVAETGSINIVVPPGELPALTLRTKRMPWDLVLEITAARIGYTAFREGSTYYIVPAGTKVDTSKEKYAGPRVTLEVKDGTLAEAITAIRALTPLDVGSCSTMKLSFRVKRMPLQQIVKALEIASGEKLTDKTVCPSKPISDEPATELALTAIASTNVARSAVFSHKGEILVGTRKSQPRLTDIGATFVTLSTGESLQLYTFGPLSEPSPSSSVPAPPSLLRTAAVIKRGEHWRAIVERLNGDPLRLDVGPWSGTSGTVEIDKNGVRVIVEGEPAARIVPLGPKP